MNTIFYQGGFQGTTCRAFYGITPRRDETTGTDIVAINSKKLGLAPSLWNTNVGRDFVLNKILATDLLGIRIATIRFFSLIDAPRELGMHGVEFPIQLDLDDYKKKGNPYQVQRVAGPSCLQRLLYWVGMGQPTFSYWNQHVVGGCANFYTDFGQRRPLSREEMKELCAAVGYQRQREGLPDWLTSQFLENSHPT